MSSSSQNFNDFLLGPHLLLEAVTSLVAFTKQKRPETYQPAQHAIFSLLSKNHVPELTSCACAVNTLLAGILNFKVVAS